MKHTRCFKPHFAAYTQLTFKLMSLSPRGIMMMQEKQMCVAALGHEWLQHRKNIIRRRWLFLMMLWPSVAQNQENKTGLDVGVKDLIHFSFIQSKTQSVSLCVQMMKWISFLHVSKGSMTCLFKALEVEDRQIGRKMGTSF